MLKSHCPNSQLPNSRYNSCFMPNRIRTQSTPKREYSPREGKRSALERLTDKPQATMHNPPSTVHRTQSTEHRTQSTIRNPQSAIHPSQSTILSLQFSVLSFQFSIFSSQFSALSSQFSTRSRPKAGTSKRYRCAAPRRLSHSHFLMQIGIGGGHWH